MKLKNIVFILLVSIFTCIASWFSYEILTKANSFTKLKTEYTEARSLNKRLLNEGKWYNLFNPLENYLVTLESQPSFDKAITDYKTATSKSYQLGIASILFLIIIIILFLKEPNKALYIGTTLLILCTVFLINGVFAPMMELGVSLNNVGEEVPFADIFQKIGSFIGVESIENKKDVLGIKSLYFGLKGETYVFFQMKSIFSVIKLLLKEGNYTVGIVILLFSVVTPLLKLLFSFLCLFTKLRNSKALLFFIHKLSKWSMLDVFVVALFMAFLSYKNMDTSGAEVTTNILMGGYYFLAFVLFSIISSYLVDASIKFKTKQEHHRN